MNKTIRLHGFGKNDSLVFSSMLVLLANKTNVHWRVTNSDNAEVVVVNTDLVTDLEEINKIKAFAKKVVTFGNVPLSDEFISLAKPLRAASILKCLSDVACSKEFIDISLSHYHSHH